MRISALHAETSALDAETSALDAEMSVIAQSYRHGVCGDCSVGVTPQMCNRVTNHGDMGTFSRPGEGDSLTERSGSSAPLPQSWKVAEIIYEYLQTHIEILKLCISKSTNR